MYLTTPFAPSLPLLGSCLGEGFPCSALGKTGEQPFFPVVASALPFAPLRDHRDGACACAKGPIDLLEKNVSLGAGGRGAGTGGCGKAEKG